MRQFRVPPKQKSRPSTTTPSQIALCASLESPQNKSPVLPQPPPAKSRYAPIPRPRKTKVPSFHKHIPAKPRYAPIPRLLKTKVPSFHKHTPAKPRSCANSASPLNTHPVSFHPVPPPYSPSIYILHNLFLCAILKPVKTTKTT